MSEPGAPDGPADPPGERDDIPNPETGAGIGAGEPSTFEPEEDAPARDGEG